MEIETLCSVEQIDQYRDEIIECLTSCFDSVKASDARVLALGKLDDLRSFLLREAAYPIAAFQGDVFLGLLWGYVVSGLAGDNFHIGYLAVLKSARGMGVGKALIKAAREKARELGCEEIELNVAQGNAAAQKLYEKCGFEIKRFYMSTPVDQ